MSVSIGTAAFDPRKPITYPSFWTGVDWAMYQKKKKRKPFNGKKNSLPSPQPDLCYNGWNAEAIGKEAEQ